MKNKREQPGYVTIISVIIIGAIATAIAISLLGSGTDATKNSLTVIRMIQARALADACAEEALENIRDDPYYTGNFNLSFPTGTCNSEVISFYPPYFTIDATGLSEGAIKKIEVTIDQTDPQINISSWQEVADF